MIQFANYPRVNKIFCTFIGKIGNRESFISTELKKADLSDFSKDNSKNVVREKKGFDWACKRFANNIWRNRKLEGFIGTALTHIWCLIKYQNDSITPNAKWDLEFHRFALNEFIFKWFWWFDTKIFLSKCQVNV